MRPLRTFVALLLCTCLLYPAWAAEFESQAPYRILVTNDDGVQAPGILALALALQTLGEVTIVAPAENQSGKGHSVSITDPIYVDSVLLPGGLPAFGVVATPASAVKVALGGLLSHRPDLVVSGINRGYNLGLVAYLSGTVGAAREAALQGIPAIASSLASAGHPRYEAAAQFTARVAAIVRSRGLDRGVFLNVNIPPGSADAIKGIRLATQSALAGTERFEERKTPRGRRYFWNIYEEPVSDVEGTDVWTALQGYVAVTPLRAGEFDRKTFDEWRDIR